MKRLTEYVLSPVGLTIAVMVGSYINYHDQKQPDRVLPSIFNSEGTSIEFQKFANTFNSDDEIHNYLTSLYKGRGDKEIHGVDDFWESPEFTWELNEGDCDGGAMLGVYLLRRLGYLADALYLSCRDGQGAHVVSVYRKNGKYGSIGINKFDRRFNIFPTVESLVDDLGYYNYSILNPSNFDSDWIATRRNMKLDQLDLKTVMDKTARR